MAKRTRVLVVDDSAFARSVLSRLLRVRDDIEVIGTARDGRDALERIEELDPDVITLDLTMPGIDGIGVLRKLAHRRRPRVLVVSMSSIDTSIGAEALTLGAVALITKPTALANDRLLEIGDELIAKVIACAGALDAVPSSEPLLVGRTHRPHPVELVVVGTSTGGPQALTRLLATLPGDFSAPIAIVLHIPMGYTQAMAQRLDRSSPLHVVEAASGRELRPGMAVLAPGGQHLRIVRHGGVLETQLSALPARPFTPSVDELFLSAAQAVGRGALGVVLTGMGDDGLEGSRAIAEAGGSLIIESESSCVVFGMPRSVADAGLGAVSVPLERMAHEMANRA